MSTKELQEYGSETQSLKHDWAPIADCAKTVELGIADVGAKNRRVLDCRFARFAAECSKTGDARWEKTPQNSLREYATVTMMLKLNT
jgi:hypothetical protein